MAFKGHVRQMHGLLMLHQVNNGCGCATCACSPRHAKAR